MNITPRIKWIAGATAAAAVAVTGVALAINATHDDVHGYRGEDAARFEPMGQPGPGQPGQGQSGQGQPMAGPAGSASVDPSTMPYFGARLALTEAGVEIFRIIPDGPAEAAGLEEGDIITSINSVALDARGSLREALSGVEPGSDVTVGYTRDGTAKTATVAVTSQADRPEVDLTEVPYLGAQMVRPDGDAPGIVVRHVDDSGPAQEAGLLSGDVILTINGNNIDSPLSAREALKDAKPGDELVLGVSRAGEPLTIHVTLGSQADAPERPRGRMGLGHGPRNHGQMGADQTGASPEGDGPVGNSAVGAPPEGGDTFDL